MANEALTRLVEWLTSRPQPEALKVEDLRLGMEIMGSKLPPPDDVAVEHVSAGGVPAEWVTAPGADPGRVMLYLHGGGYAVGSIGTHRGLAGRLAQATAARVLLIDYRLAPEYPFPASVQDATTAYHWLLGEGVKPERLTVAGDSAGGGLTIAALVALRDAGDPLPAAAVCQSPWVDLEGTGESITTKADVDPIVRKELLEQMADWYLAKADPRTPLAAPLYADLHGLPPLLIQVGTAEILLDDAIRLAANARQAGVDVTLEPWEDMIHVWQLFAPMLPEGQQAIDRIGAFVKQHTS
jgi:monoterpene epsilon-lactone hydrolase